MGSVDRSKKSIQVWRKALLHFSLCFVMGLFTGFAPINTASIFSSHGASTSSLSTIEARQDVVHVERLSRVVMGEPPVSLRVPEQTLSPAEGGEDRQLIVTRKLLILITTAVLDNSLQGVMMRRLSNTLKLIQQPLVWIVVGAHSDSSEMPKMMRRTGIMYRHLVSKKNFTDPGDEADYQRNLALNHIEHHRLDGIVHFVELSHYYDLQLFEQLREIKTIGTWPIAKLSAYRKRVVLDGPICSSSSSVAGWHLNNRSKHQTSEVSFHLSNFAFNSSILWDPERWGRISTAKDTSQDSIDFIKQVAIEDESKLMCIQSNSHKIMMWHLKLPELMKVGSNSQNENDRHKKKRK